MLTSSIKHEILRIAERIRRAQRPRVIDIVNLGVEIDVAGLRIEVIMHHLVEKDPHLILPHAGPRRRFIGRDFPDEVIGVGIHGRAAIARGQGRLGEEDGAEDDPGGGA